MKTLSKILSFTLITSLILSVSTNVFAEDTTEYYAVETNSGNSENPDPVYIPLNESNSQVNEGSVEYTGETQEGKSYEVVSKEVAPTTVYQITDEKTNVTDLEAGNTYTFVKGDGSVQVGDVLERPLEGGAVLTYAGDGKNVSLNNTSPSTSSVCTIFQNDITMVENAQQYLSYKKSIQNRYAGCSSPGEIEKVSVQLIAEDYGYENVNSFSELVDAFYAENSNYYTSREEAESSVNYYVEYLYNNYAISEIPDLASLLAEMKAVDATNEDAVLAYLGMTANEVKTFKGNLRWSNTPVVKNSGIVNVVTPGNGFDTCTKGAIFYREDLGWTYACTGGGVDMGDASGLHLYSVDTKTLGANAFSVTAGDSIQLNENGTGVAGLKNVKAYVTLPNGDTKELVSFEFLDDKVNLNDPHVTAIVGGRYYTVTLNLKKWIQEKTENIPVVIEPVAEPTAPVVTNISETKPIETLSARMNSGIDFSGIVKNVNYGDELYVSNAKVENNNLEISAVVTNGKEEIRRLVLDKGLISEITGIQVNNIVFSVGRHVLTIGVNQFKDLTDVVITIDPVTQKIIILVNGVDRTSDFEFLYEIR